MKTALWLSACACAALAVAFPLTAGDKGKDTIDVSKLPGTYKYIAGIKNGDKMTADQLKGQSVVITKETITLKSEAGTFVMKYDIDAKKSPATVKLTITESPFGAGAKAEGVIELKGDDLKLCYAPEGTKAPTTFEAKEGSKAHFFELKRTK